MALTDPRVLKRLAAQRASDGEPALAVPLEYEFDPPIVVTVRAPVSIYNGREALAIGERDFGQGATDVVVDVSGHEGPARLGFARAELSGALP